MDIGNKLKELRVLKGLTQEELADRSELSKGFISQLERNLTSPSITTLMDILQCLEDSETEIATTYSNMAQIYLLDNDLQKAADACGLSVSLFEKISGDSDVHYSAAIETRGQISLIRGEKDKALADFRKALSLIERDYGRDTPAANALHGLIARVEQEVGAK